MSTTSTRACTSVSSTSYVYYISTTHITTCDNKSVCLCVCTLTFNQLLHLMSHPLRSWRLWPTNERETPGWADWGQQRERTPLRTPGLARLVWTAVVISLKVTWIQHQERSHQHDLQQLQWEITQLLQKHYNIVRRSTYGIVSYSKHTEWQQH